MREGFISFQSGKGVGMNREVEFYYSAYQDNSKDYIVAPKLGVTFSCNILPESRSEGGVASNTWWLYIPESCSVSDNICAVHTSLEIADVPLKMYVHADLKKKKKKNSQACKNELYIKVLRKLWGKIGSL